MNNVLLNLLAINKQPQFMAVLERINRLNDSPAMKAIRALQVNSPALTLKSSALESPAVANLLRAVRAADVIFNGFVQTDVFERLREVFDKLNSDSYLITLAQNGWFIDDGMSYSDMIEIAQLFEDGAAVEAESRLIAHFSERAPEICKELIELFPERTQALEQGFSAHSKEMYFASVLVMLVQADGICKSICNFGIYKKGRDQRPKITSYAQDQVERNVAAKTFLGQFDASAKIFSDFTPGQKQYDHLSRHAVIHGVDTEYGTKVNSLKAISWLGYVALALTPEKEDEAA